MTNKALLAGATGLFLIMLAPAAHAGGPGGGGPVELPGDDPLDPEADPTPTPTPAPTPTPSPTPTPTGAVTPAALSGSGAYLFTLDSLPTGASGTQAFYQPEQVYDGGLVIASAQGGLNQTVNGLTLSLRTATANYAAGTGVPQTSIRVENDSTNFNYLGVPSDVGVGILATTLSPAAPGAIFANFDQSISYFSVDLYRLSGNFTVTTTLTAYSGLNGTGDVLGTVQGAVTGGNNYATTLVQLGGLAGARSVGLLGTNLANYNNITADVGAAAVPEPASWAVMLLGTGLAGGALRARRRRVRFAA